MCVAVAVNPGARLTHSEWDKCWSANPDGGGYAYLHRGKLIVQRGLSRADLWRRYFKDAQNNPKSPFILHFRIATHGNVCLDNTHPFIVDHRHSGSTVLAHNGIIANVLTDLEPNESDTRAFIRLYARFLPAGWMDNAAIVELVEHYIGTSLIVMLTTDKAASRNLYILNESLGTWDGDRWFSNEHWRFGGYVTCGRGIGDWMPNAWMFDADTRVWSRAVKVKDATHKATPAMRSAAAHVDSHGVKHEPWLPNGTMPLIGMSQDALTDIMIDAIDGGFCERCLWKPCWCDGVCFDCTRPMDECECGMELSCATYYGHHADSDGMTWLDANGPVPKYPVLARTPQARDVADLTLDDWLELERSMTGKVHR